MRSLYCGEPERSSVASARMALPPTLLALCDNLQIGLAREYCATSASGLSEKVCLRILRALITRTARSTVLAAPPAHHLLFAEA